LRFWDTSAIIPLAVEESTSGLMDYLLREDAEIMVWWGTEVECVSALSSVFRDERFSRRDLEGSLQRIGVLIEAWSEVQPVDEVRIQAERLLFAYRLRAMDAQQLGAALLWCDGRAQEAELVSLDHRMRIAARNEGFAVLPGERDLQELT
jgi:uncharacterized protein with PIN domain